MPHDKFFGKWESTKYENWDDFMKIMQVGFVVRKIGAKATTYMEVILDEDGETWIWNWKIAIESGGCRFKLEEEFDNKTPDGRPVKETLWWEGDTLMSIQKGKPTDVTITRNIIDDGNTIHEICEAKGVKCVRYYKRTG